MKVERYIDPNSFYQKNSAEKLQKDEKGVLSTEAVIFDRERNQKESAADQNQNEEKKQAEEQESRDTPDTTAITGSEAAEAKPLNIVA